MQTINLTSHFLIAMPAMSDPNFSRTLTFICEHNERGALGIVVNRPIEVTLGSLFRQVEIAEPGSPKTATYWSMMPPGTPTKARSARWQSCASCSGSMARPPSIARATETSSAADELRPDPVGTVL